MVNSLRFDEFIETNYLRELDDFNKEVVNITSNRLLDEYREVVVTQLIKQFGLSGVMPAYKDGGNVTTFHNSQNQVFANENDEKRFNKKYDRKDYEKNIYNEKGELERAGLQTINNRLLKTDNSNYQIEPSKIKVKIRSKTEPSKQRVKLTDESKVQIENLRSKSIDSNGMIIDAYNNELRYARDKKERKNGESIHIDHTVSAAEIHGRDDLRLFMTDEERAKLALHDKNLNYTEGSANQSKGERQLKEWAKSLSPKNPTETNQERFNLDNTDIDRSDRIAREHIVKEAKTARRNYYNKKTAKTSATQGLKIGMNQMLGILMYELQYEIIIEMKKYFKNFTTYKSISIKIKELKNCFERVKDKLIKKSKKIMVGFSTGFISGFISNILTIIVNTFITTTKRWVKIITEGFTGLLQSLKILFSISKDDTADSSEKFREASKVFSTAVLASLGGVMTESLIAYLKTTPFAAFATPIGLVVGGILTGLITITVIYLIDDYKQVLESFKDMFKKTDVSQEELIKNYNNIMSKMEEDYQLILKDIYNQYERLHQIANDAFNQSLHFSKRFDNNIIYAEAMEVKSDKIVRNEKNIDEFFLE